MTKNTSVLESLKARGEEVFAKVSGELMSSPHFMKALQAAMQGKQVFDQAASRALKQMNIPSRTEFKRALARIEALEHELAALKARPKRERKPRKPAEPAPPEAAEPKPDPASPGE